MDKDASQEQQQSFFLHKSAGKSRIPQPSAVSKKRWRLLIALALFTLLFCCTASLLHTTKSFAVTTDITVTPAPIGSTTTPLISTPSPTVGTTPTQVPTVAPSPTVAATPKPTPRPQPTATPVATVGVTATVGIAPTAVATQKVSTAPAPVATQRPRPTVTPTMPPTPLPLLPTPTTVVKTAAVARTTARREMPTLPLMVGTFVLLCLCGAGLIGFRRVRTARMLSKTLSIHNSRSWQRVRTEEQPVVLPPGSIPLTPLPLTPPAEALIFTDPLLQRPRSRRVRGLSRVRLQPLQKQMPVEAREKETQ